MNTIKPVKGCLLMDLQNFFTVTAENSNTAMLLEIAGNWEQ